MGGLLQRYWKQTKEARESGAGNYFVPGLYVVRVKKTELAETQGTGNQIWFRVHYEVVYFKGTRHKTYFKNDQNLPDFKIVDSSDKIEIGQTVSTVLNFADKQYQGACNTIFTTLLSGLAPFKEKSFEEIQSLMDMDDVEKMIEENLAEGMLIVTEVINPGKNKVDGHPTSDFSKHISWAPMGPDPDFVDRYTGHKWWEEEKTHESEDL